MSATNALAPWRILKGSAFGRWLFARVICLQAPYFSTIRPRIDRLEPGACEARMRKRRAVLNHVGSVHAIALCNLAELVAQQGISMAFDSREAFLHPENGINY